MTVQLDHGVEHENGTASARGRAGSGLLERMVLLAAGALVVGMTAGVFVGSVVPTSSDSEVAQLRAELDLARHRLASIEALERVDR